jgi:hypothetical protein
VDERLLAEGKVTLPTLNTDPYGIMKV